MNARAAHSGRDGMLSVAAIRRRGWTDADLKLLGAPDKTKRNPHHAAGAPMRLYAPGRVAAIENSPAFLDRAADRERRRAAAKKAAATKRNSTSERAAELVAMLRIDSLPPYPTLLRWAIGSQLSRAAERADIDADPYNAPAETKARWVTNYVRHRMSNYESALLKIQGLVGTGDAYARIRAAVDRKVAAAIDAVNGAPADA